MTAPETAELPLTGTHAADRRLPTLALLALCFGCVALDNTKLVAAMPTLARTYGESPALHWVVESGLLVYASLLLLGGSLCERFGARPMLLAGLAAFAAGSAAAPLATTTEELIALRVVVGAGAALITPATLGTVKHLYDERERPFAISVWTAGYGIFGTLGPVVSGWVLERFAPSAILLVNVPIAAFAFVCALRLVPKDLPLRAVPLDVTSVALAFAGTASLLYAILEAPFTGIEATPVRAAFALAVALYAALVAWQKRAPHPLLDPALFREPRFRFPLGVILLGYLAFSGTAFVVTQSLQVARGHSVFDAGLRTMPLTLALLTGTLAAPAVMTRLGDLRALVATAVLAAAGAMLLAWSSTAASDLWLCLAQVPFGVGCGCTFVNATESVLGTAPSERAGTAAAINEGAFEFGGVIGVAVLGAVLGSPLAAESVFRVQTAHALWAGAASVTGAALLAVLLVRRATARSDGACPPGLGSR